MSTRRRRTDPRRPHRAVPRAGLLPRLLGRRRLATCRGCSKATTSSTARAARWKKTPASSSSSPTSCSAGPTTTARCTCSNTSAAAARANAGCTPSAASASAGTSRRSTPPPATSQHVYREGMRRELDEEVVIDTPYTERIVGLINDDETPVGQVHLGVVHLCDVEQPARPAARGRYSRRPLPPGRRDPRRGSTSSKAGRKSPCGHCSAKPQAEFARPIV